jgi:hypothetical protein
MKQTFFLLAIFFSLIVSAQKKNLYFSAQGGYTTKINTPVMNYTIGVKLGNVYLSHSRMLEFSSDELSVTSTLNAGIKIGFIEPFIIGAHQTLSDNEDRRFFRRETTPIITSGFRYGGGINLFLSKHIVVTAQIIGKEFNTSGGYYLLF